MSLTTGSKPHGLGHEDPPPRPGPELVVHQAGVYSRNPTDWDSGSGGLR